MKILHLIWTLGGAGAEEMLVDIANEQCRVQQVWIIVVNDPVECQTRARIDPRVKVSLLGRKPGTRGMKPLLHLNWLIRRIRPDVIHVHTWSLVKLIPFCPSKIVLTVHTTEDAAGFDDSVARYDAVFAVSEAVADEVYERTKGVRPTVVLNGINCAEIRFNKRTAHSLFRIVQVARLEHRCKGQDILLRAVALVRDQLGGDGISLDFIGQGGSRQVLEDMVRDLRLEKCVRFRGALPRSVIYDEVCAYDVLVQASRYEGFGLAVVEAMTAGVPVLVSDLEGPRGVVGEGRFGFLFRSDDYVDCAQAIQHIREMKVNEPATLMHRVRAAREHALEAFDVKRTAREYLDGYRDSLGVDNQMSCFPISEIVAADGTQGKSSVAGK